ncbi:unnamed protein product [Schistocephalus solidus]|uniref:BTB/POZ domain-containing protein n=1 Tax=Schistocephalus solidus TaxID=70667 RepID=A0A183T1T5_SCHSO|nr:unnamed protein product [Schistocephalus solidus]
MFYGYIRSERKHRDKISIGNILAGGPQKFQLLSQFFRSSFKVDSSDDNPDLVMGEDTAVIETVAFSVDKVRRVLNQIKLDKSPGLDEIPGLILKELSAELAMPLSSLFEL